MSGDGDIRSLIEEVESYLHWQKRLGHPGLPWELLRKRRIAEQEKLTQQSDADTTVTTPASKANPAPTVNDPSASESKKEAVSMPKKTTKAQAPVSDMPPVEEEQPLLTSPTQRPTLQDVQEELGDCTRCKLHSTRNKIVFGEGDPNAEIMFIGEGPGADEDAQGRPFVGRAGKLLDKWIELGMGIPREKVYIGNIVKCRPPNNRDPERDEVSACIGFIKKQVHAINPKVIILLGRVPMGHLLGEKTGITKVHGTWYRFEGIPTMPIFHPSYCLRPPLDEKRRLVWEDIKKVLTYLEMPIPTKKG